MINILCLDTLAMRHSLYSKVDCPLSAINEWGTGTVVRGLSTEMDSTHKFCELAELEIAETEYAQHFPLIHGSSARTPL